MFIWRRVIAAASATVSILEIFEAQHALKHERIFHSMGRENINLGSTLEVANQGQQQEVK